MNASSVVSKSRNSDAPERRVVTIGGGTGTFTVLSGLRAYGNLDLSAIVTMADEGGSTGRLRDEYGVLPPGDLRQCLVALSDAPQVMRELFSFRYDRGDLKGHSFGNIFISTLEQMTGDLARALDIAGEVLKIRGAVIPVTLDKIQLVAELGNGTRLKGEQALTNCRFVSRLGIKRIRLAPRAKANPKALAAIKRADLIVVGPGNFYSSIVPNFLVPGIASAVRRSKAKKVFVANLMNKDGQTDGFTAATYVTALERLSGGRLFDAVLYNTKRPPESLLRRYVDEGEPVSRGAHEADSSALIGKDLLARGLYRRQAGDTLPRTLIRHDSTKLAKALYELLP
ncbi:MAG: YvcK family protein [bacterium]|nr:YvcK family protein [bacterium]